MNQHWISPLHTPLWDLTPLSQTSMLDLRNPTSIRKKGRKKKKKEIKKGEKKRKRRK